MRSVNDQVSLYDAAQLIWNYLRVDDALVPADSIVIFGGNDIRVALDDDKAYRNRFESQSDGASQTTESTEDNMILQVLLESPRGLRG